jgi:hypothetical protein
MENSLVFYTVGVSLPWYKPVLSPRRRSLLLSLRRLFPIVSDKNILYEIGDFNLNAAQVVSIFTIVLLSYINSRGVKISKTLQTF